MSPNSSTTAADLFPAMAQDLDSSSPSNFGADNYDYFQF